MADKNLKVAVTGLGVSRKYLPNYVRAPECELALVHDVKRWTGIESASRQIF